MVCGMISINEFFIYFLARDIFYGDGRIFPILEIRIDALYNIQILNIPI